MPKTLVMTTLQIKPQPEKPPATGIKPILRQFGYKKTKARNRVCFGKPPENEVVPTEQNIIALHGFSKSDLKEYNKESRFNDWQFLGPKFSTLG